MANVLHKKDFEILDSLRGIAALYVTIGHCRGSLWMGGEQFLKLNPMSTWHFYDYVIFGISLLSRLAVEFVIVFFVLSGFSIAHSLSANKSPGKFYIRRLIRIYPPYLVALIWASLVYAVTLYLLPQWYDGSMREFVFSRTITMNNFFDWDVMLKNIFYMPHFGGFIGPFWSLTYEVMFYLMAPFLLRRVNLYFIISFMLFLIDNVFPASVEALHLHKYFYEFLFVYNIYFAIGVLLYNYFPVLLRLVDKIHPKLFLVAILSVWAVVYAFNIYFQMETNYSFMAAAFLSAFMITYFIRHQVTIPWLMSIGKFSYTLYITHYPTLIIYLAIYHLIVVPDKNYIENFLIWIPAVFFCIAVAYIHYLLVENKTKNILDRLRRKRYGRISDIKSGSVQTERNKI
ncbi:MAG: acyltransferase family protein [Chitinophagaceae bacterium]